MDVINIHNWSSQQVLNWIKGLDDSLQRYELNFKNASVLGRQLLNLSYEDLYNLQINQLGHQELILDAVGLLQQLDYSLDTETLQSRAMCLKSRCRGLRSSVAARREEVEEYEYEGGLSLHRGASNELLVQTSDILNEGKQLVLWLDRPPFNSKQTFQTTRNKLVELCYELSVTLQQSVFACVIEDATLGICNELETCADGIVQSNDPVTVQPVSLEVVRLRDVDPAQGLGIFIKATFEGHHVVTGTRQASLASRTRRIVAGDEVVAVNGTVVVGWTLTALVSALKERPHDVSLLLKKRPQIQRSSSSSNLLNVLQRSEEDRSKIFRVVTPIKRIQDPSKPVRQLPSSEPRHPSNHRRSSGTWSSRRSRDAAEEISQTSGSDLSDRYVSSTTFDSERSAGRASTGKLPLSACSNLPLPYISVDASSPMDVLKFPPPPSVPYTPKSNHLSVQHPPLNTGTSRSASPNSLLDIEHKRRYTVIGGSTVDERWYEDFLSDVNKRHFDSSNNKKPQEKLSHEEVFLSSNQPQNPCSVIHENRRRKRSPKPPRPMSMPPNYHCQPHANAPLFKSAIYHSCQQSFSSRDSFQSRRSSHSSRVDPIRYYHNNNNNCSVETSSNKIKTGKAPPKPPPRSSSIPKLIHRLTSDSPQLIDHPRQSSLPEKNYFSVLDGEKRHSLDEKPVIPPKPKKVPLSKTTSTPHLQHHKHQPHHSSSSGDKRKYSSGIRPDITSANVQRSSPQPSQCTGSSADTNSPRPVPKPRLSRKKAKEKEGKNGDARAMRERSGSAGNLLERKSPGGFHNRSRRKSAEYISHKKREDVVGASSLRSHPVALVRSSPTRLSYSSAISSNQGSSVSTDADLRSNDAPKSNELYEVRVIAGVPVRLRKSITRITGSKLKVAKTPPDKDKAKTSRSSGTMKKERRVSCRDLGKGDCQGWLWKKKSGADLTSNGPLSSKWSKRYVVIKNRAIYCYRESSTDTDQKAECYISLPGYTVAPAQECKRKFAFRITHIKRKTFFFAAERQMDMSRWMNKMGLAAIEYKFSAEKSNGDAPKSKDTDYYSESEEDGISGSVAESSPGSSSSALPEEEVFCEGRGPPRLNRLLTTGAFVPDVNGPDDPKTRSKSESDLIDGARESVSNRSTCSGEESLLSVDGGGEDGFSNAGSFKFSTSLASLIDDFQGRRMSISYQESEENSHVENKEVPLKHDKKFSHQQNKETLPVQDFDHCKPPLDYSMNPASSSNLETVMELQSDEQEFPDPSDAVEEHRSTPPKAMKSFSSFPALVKTADKPIKRVPDFRRPPAKSEPPPFTFDKSLSPPLGDPLRRLRRSIKAAEIDILGGSRRVTLRRKMTVLASDPQMNERLLRKRALERELKAKELELAYFDKLLNKENITHSDLHSWINQHPSLFAEIGTIRRMSKLKRPPKHRSSKVSNPPDGSVASWSSASSCASTTDGRNNDRLGGASANNNNNNSRATSPPRDHLEPISGLRPRSSALSSADLNPPADSSGAGPKSRTLPHFTKSYSTPRRRKVPHGRPFPTNFSGEKPYLETDL